MNNNTETMIPVRVIAAEIGLTQSALRSLGLSIQGEMPLSEAIAFTQARTTATGRRKPEQAMAANNYLKTLLSMANNASVYQTTDATINGRLSDDQTTTQTTAATIEQQSSVHQTTPNNVQTTVSDDQATIKQQWSTLAFRAICILIVIAHATLIYKDAAIIWGGVGKLAGAMAFLFQIGAVLVATDETRVRTSASAVWFVCLIDVAAWFLHYPAFLAGDPDVSNMTTGVTCAFLCAISFTALYLYRDSIID